MKKTLLTVVCGFMALMPLVAQTPFVNLTPKAKLMSTPTGELPLPEGFVVNTANLPDSLVTEATKFVNAINLATPLNAATATDDASALIQMTLPTTDLDPEGYKLIIKEDGVRVEAETSAGFYYAFQTLKKILPANVMAGVKDEAVTAYALPIVNISDEPRFGYRGFMLDVARHFFTVEEVKRMIDIMAVYKMNRFHWHLTDDQGWRVEIKRYPKLTTVGATRANSWTVDMNYGDYWTNETYGPYFYTQEEIKDVVAYAKERHIEIIPEIDMPGHFVAAMTAYPEYSCWPEGAHALWVTGGISNDVLNVANPEAVQFAKNILEELCELFPYNQIHIGGDECPTSAWEGNALCQQRYRELGLTNYRQLQSHFIKEIGEFLASKGKKMAMWNESITAGGADLDMMRETGATVYCWTPCQASAKKAAEMGLPNVVTEYSNGYYINRKQWSTGEPTGAGYGTDNLETVYNYVPVPSNISSSLLKYYTGVQGTFWTEHVANREYMEYLALPRLLAVAEAGWTQQKDKNFADFKKRFNADTKMLDYNGYEYGKHYVDKEAEGEGDGKVMPKTSTAEETYWYRIVTKATDARSGRCWELLSETSPLVAEHSGKNAAAGRIWTNTKASEGDANYDYQQWCFEQSDEHPDRYALVCKAQPEGSINPTPTAQNNTGRWNYDATVKHYAFVIGDGGYGPSGANYYYTVRSENISGWYLNASMAGQGMAVNLWSNAADGAGGHWEFQPLFELDEAPVLQGFEWLKEGSTYAFRNAVKEGLSLADNKKAATLTYTEDRWANDAWEVTKSVINADSTQTVRLKNVGTNRYIAAPASNATSRLGYIVGIGSTATDIVISINPEGDFTLMAGGKNFYPVSTTSPAYAGAISAGNTDNSTGLAIRPQGAAWNIEEVKVVTYTCEDEQGNALGTFTCSEPIGDETFTPVLPEIKNHTYVSYDAERNVYIYKRECYSVILRSVDTYGGIISETEVPYGVGEVANLTPEDHDYFTYESTSLESNTFTPTSDTLVVHTYSTDAWSGVKAVAGVVNKLENGRSYLIYDTSPNATERIGFRNIAPSNLRVVRANSAEDQTPYYTWTFEGRDKKFKVKNEYTGLYIPKLTQSGQIILGKAGDTFTFTLNDDGETWKVMGTNSQYWDGVADGFTGWHTYGHPYKFFEYYVQPYFTVTVEFVNAEGTAVSPAQAKLVKAGESVTLVLPEVNGHAVKTIENAEAMEQVGAHATVKVIYEDVTGIDDLPTLTPADNAIYDLSGRRVKVAQKGIYIIGGKKVVK